MSSRPSASAVSSRTTPCQVYTCVQEERITATLARRPHGVLRPGPHKGILLEQGCKQLTCRAVAWTGAVCSFNRQRRCWGGLVGIRLSCGQAGRAPQASGPSKRAARPGRAQCQTLQPAPALPAQHRTWAANYARSRHRKAVSKHGQHTVTSSSLLSLTSMRSSWPWKTGNSVSLVLHGGALYSAAKPGGTHLRQLVLLFEGHHFIAPSTSSAAKRALQ